MAMSPSAPRHSRHPLRRWLRASDALRPWRSLAVVAVFALLASVVTMGTPRVAEAFVPASIPPASGAAPVVTTTVTHGLVGGNQPKQGDTFTYTATFVLSNMTEPSVTNKVTVTVNTDPNAPWTAVPTATNFASPFGTPTLSGCSTTSCSATYANVTTNGTITFSAPAKVAASLPSGTPIVLTADAKIDTTPAVSLAPVTSTFVGDTTGGPNDCSGTFTFAQTLTAGGAWLLDLHFADGTGQGKVQLDANAQIYAYNNNPTGSKNTIKVVDVSGNDITATVFAKATYLSPDPTKPYFPGDAIQTQYPNARWLDSLNWKWDPSTWTGDTWLPAGSTVTVTRHVTNLNCSAGGFTTDADTARPFGMSMEIARPMTSVRSADVDTWSMPGVLAPYTCANKLYSSTTVGTLQGTSSTYSQWDPSLSLSTSVTTSTYVSQAIAASTQYPSYLFILDRANGSLHYRDLGTAPNTDQLLNATSYPVATPTPIGLAFDATGNLWGLDYDKLFYLTAADIATLLGGGTASWKLGATLKSSTGTTLIGGADIAFDGNGVLYTVPYGGTNVPLLKYAYPLTTLQTPGSLNATFSGATGVSPSSTSTPFRGLAFVGDTLYLGRYTNSLYAVNLTTGAATLQSGVGYSASGLSDFASCAFPTFAPTFAVRKAPINANGSVGPWGGTGTAYQVNPDGTLTVSYVVTVSNTSTYTGTFPTISDTMTPPAGFTLLDVTVDGLSKGSSGTFTIPGVSLTSGQSVTYLVSATLRAVDLAAINWTTASTCNTTGAGTSGSGFFNRVSMTGDQDGTTNNDACVPVTPPFASPARLALTKRIVNSDGTEVTGSVDSRAFTLIAGGATAGLSPVSGTSSTSGTIAVDKPVVPGTYILAEEPNDGGAVSGGYTPGTWTCVNRATGASFPVTNHTITLAAGNNVACTMTNVRNPKVKVVKNAADPIATNSHVGQTVSANPDGTFRVSYTITVTNLSAYIGDTGPINDYFVPPAGLVWDGTKVAQVTYLPGTTGATIATPTYPLTATRSQLQDGLTLASSIHNLPAGASVSFTLSIPLALDLTVAAGQTQSTYALNSAALATCTSATSTGGNAYTDTTQGIPNVVALTGEDQGYNDIPLKDNIACIPVTAATTWKVQKAAAQTVAPDGTVTAWAPAGTTGTPVHFATDGTVTVRYQVVLTNTGGLPSNAPAIPDTITLPTGFTLTGVVVSAGATTVYSGSSTSFNIPGTTSAVLPGATLTYTVVLTATAPDPSAVDWTVAGTCTTSGGGTPSAGGFFNLVTLTGDSDGPDNNDACVPVTPPTVSVTISKVAENCDVGQPTCPLPGASFLLYAVDPATAGAAPMPSLGVDPTQSVFTGSGLVVGQTYWLLETRSPEGFALLAAPVPFTVTATGIQLVDPAADGDLVTVTGTNGLGLTVVNAPAADLPKAGGPGFLLDQVHADPGALVAPASC